MTHFSFAGFSLGLTESQTLFQLGKLWRLPYNVTEDFTTLELIKL